MGAGSYRHIVHTKLMPPTLTPDLVVRERVLALMSSRRRLTLLSAMPGYGKTALVRQWIDTLDLPVAWVSLDLLDRDPTTFWAHVIHALASACPQIDDEPDQLLRERGPDDPLFLSALIAQLAATPGPSSFSFSTDYTPNCLRRSSTARHCSLIELARQSTSWRRLARIQRCRSRAGARSAGWSTCARATCDSLMRRQLALGASVGDLHPRHIGISSH